MRLKNSGRILSHTALALGLWAGSATAQPTPTPTPTPTVAPATEVAEQPLTLEQSIAIALQNHGDVGVAAEQFSSAQQRVTVARSPLYPQVSAAVTRQDENSRSRSSSGVSGFGSSQSRSSSNSATQGNIILSQTFFDMNQTHTQVRAAKARARGAEAGVEVARENVAQNVAQTYFEQLRQEKLLALAKEQVTLAKQNVESVQAEAAAGTKAKVDVLPVEVDLRQREFNLVAADNNVRVAQTNFRNALGLEPGPGVKLAEVSETTLPPAPELQPALDEAGRLRPELAQARANVEQAQANEALAKIQSRPTVEVTGSYLLGVLDAPLDRQAQLTAGLSVPIFNGGSRRANARAARSDREASEIQLKQLTKDVEADIETAREQVNSATQQVASAKALVETAQSSLDVAREKYRLGLGIALEVATAQSQLFNAQISQTQTIYDYYLAQSRLDRAIGRLSERAAPVAPAVAAPVVAPAPLVAPVAAGGGAQ